MSEDTMLTIEYRISAGQVFVGWASERSEIRTTTTIFHKGVPSDLLHDHQKLEARVHEDVIAYLNFTKELEIPKNCPYQFFQKGEMQPRYQGTLRER